MERTSAESILIFWNKFKKDRLALLGLSFMTFLVIVSILGPLIRPDSSENANHQVISLAKLPPLSNVSIHEDDTPCDQVQCNASHNSRFFLLGSDRFGRDVLSRLMAGTQISLMVGFIAVFISLVVGITIGLLAGYYRGWVDMVLSWFINVIWSIPSLLIVMAFILAFGTGFWKVFMAIGLTMWVEVARVVRGQVLGIRKRIHRGRPIHGPFRFQNIVSANSTQPLARHYCYFKRQFFKRHFGRKWHEFFGIGCPNPNAQLGQYDS